MLTTLRVPRATLLALGTLGYLSSCSKEQAEPVTAQSAQDAKKVPATQQELKAAWENFVQKVEKGEWKDAFGQYVSKDTYVASNGQERPTRPKKDAEKREFKRITRRSSNGDITSLMIPIDEPCPYDAIDCGGSGGGGGYTPPNYTFVTTEDVQPYGASPFTSNPTGTSSRPAGFYTTENPNGYLFDLKIVKGRGSYQPTFNGSNYYT